MVPFFQSSAGWRVGLLVTTIVMGVALASTGISGYLRARESAEIITRVEVMGVLRELRREIARSPLDARDAVSALVSESGEDGLLYVALLDAGGNPMASFGRSDLPLSERLVADVMRAPRGRGRGPEPPLIRYTDSDVVQVAAAMPRRRIPHGRPGGSALPDFIVFEAVSSAGPRVVSNALLAMIIALGAAALLVTVALLLFRQSRLAEADARAMEEERLRMLSQLEKDKRLKTLGRMSAVLGHELKNPIAALKGHAQLLLEKLPEDHPSRQQARTVVFEAELLETLTVQVLEFARTGELTVSKVYVDDLVLGAAAISSVSHVDVSAPEGVAWYLDRPRMEEALTNLLVNARQASRPEDPVELAAEVRGDELVIAVRDRGEGIPEGEEARIFQPFHTKKARGTGLGLALVKRIVEGHGGDVTARNREGGGAELVLRIPRHPPAPRAGEADG